MTTSNHPHSKGACRLLRHVARESAETKHLRQFPAYSSHLGLSLLCGLAVFFFSPLPAFAESFVAPYSGTLYIRCIGGSAGATSDFGTGTNPADWTPYLRSLPPSCPTTEVRIGSVTTGQVVPFAMRTQWLEREYWAFSTAQDEASTAAFSDSDNSLKMGGKTIEQTAPDTWVMHLDDAASYTVDDNDADFLIQIRLVRTSSPVTQNFSLQAAPQHDLSSAAVTLNCANLMCYLTTLGIETYIH